MRFLRVDKQREDFKRLGVSGDWDHPYVTLTPDYEAAQIRVFGEMANKAISTVGLSQFTGLGLLNQPSLKQRLNTMIWYQRLFTMRTRLKMVRVSLDTDTYIVVWTTTHLRLQLLVD